MSAPVLETGRLLLRAHRIADFDAAFAMWSDPAVTRFIGGKPSTQQQTWSRIINYAGLWVLLGYGYWAVEDKATGAFAGELGFADFHRDIAASMRGVPELGWALAPQFHGRGYATEAVHAVVAWGDRAFDRGRTVCMIDPGNAASIRVAEKCGYRTFERGTFGGAASLFLERRPDAVLAP